MLNPDLSRREAVVGMGLLLSAGAATTARANPLPSLQASIRNAMLLRPDIRYFNTANVGPTFASAAAAQQAAEQDFNANPSFENRAKYSGLAISVRGAFARRLSAEEREIAILRNASEANAVVANGLALVPGDEVVVTDHNHESNLNSWMARAARGGLTVKIAVLPTTPSSPQDVFDAIERVFTPRTRVLAVSHVSNINGLILPARDLAELARGHNAWFHLDAAQSMGWMQLDVRALSCDSLTGSGQKWLMGPPGSGLLYVRQANQDRLPGLFQSLNYWSSHRPDLGAEKYEWVGQRVDARLAALDTVLGIWDGYASGDVEGGVRSVAASLRRALAGVKGLRIAGLDTPELYGPIILAEFENGQDPRRIESLLWTEHQISTAGVSHGALKGCRLSPHIFTSYSDVEVAARCVGALAA